MKLEEIKLIIKEGWPGVLLACILGYGAYLAKDIGPKGLIDPLILAIFVGMIVRLLVGRHKVLLPGINLAPSVLIPIGILFYGAAHLNFKKFFEISGTELFIEVLAVITFFAVILYVSKMINLKKQIGYLVAMGSSVCGASAIAITAPVVKAEPDDVAVALLTVAVIGCVGLWVIIPYLSSTLEMNEHLFAMLCATILPFTGFVKISLAGIKETMKSVYEIGMSAKALRLGALVIAIPALSIYEEKKFHIPWYIIGFILCAVVFSYAPMLSKVFTPIIKPWATILWSIAMAALGLNANLKVFFSENGLKAIFAAFVGLLAVIVLFVVAYDIAGYFAQPSA